jgi:hypothetical protein
MFNMTDEARLNLIEAWVEKNKPKRYNHGERPEGDPEPQTISVWRKSKKRKSAEEKQAELDAAGDESIL